MTELGGIEEGDIQLLQSYEMLHLIDRVGKEWLLVGEAVARFSQENRIKPRYPDPFLASIAQSYQEANSTRRKVEIKDVNNFIEVMKEMGRFPKIIGDPSYNPVANARRFRRLSMQPPGSGLPITP